MCLYINRRKHRKTKTNRIPKARVAKCDLLVWKRAMPVSNTNELKPFFRRGSGNWVFGVKRVARFSFDYLAKGIRLPARHIVNAGLHANMERQYRMFEFPAIIPKGAKFYYGKDGDIVATSMTIYPTIAEALQGRTLRKAKEFEHKYER